MSLDPTMVQYIHICTTVDRVCMYQCSSFDSATGPGTDDTINASFKIHQPHYPQKTTTQKWNRRCRHAPLLSASNSCGTLLAPTCGLKIATRSATHFAFALGKAPYNRITMHHCRGLYLSVGATPTSQCAQYTGYKDGPFLYTALPRANL